MMREEQREKRRPQKRRPRRRRKRLNPKAIPVLIALFLIVLIAGILVGRMLYEKYSPSKEQADLNAYFDLMDTEEMAIIMNDTILDEKALYIDDTVYLDVKTVYDYLNTRFYWDSTENLYLCALPTELVSVGAGESGYTVAKASESEDYVILRVDGSNAYVALDFVQKYTNFTYEYWEEPNHVHIITEFGSRDVVTAQKNAVVRYQAGIKSPILTTVEKSTTVYVLEESEEIEEWIRVLTKDGYIGYICDKNLSSVTQETIEEPEFEEPECTSISKDYTINLAWHQVTNMDANDTLLTRIADAKGLTTISPTWFFDCRY